MLKKKSNKLKDSLKPILSNFSYAFSANFFTMLISALTVLVVPKLIGVADFGYWQLYMLYVSYTGVIQLGWCDGIYLKYGGYKYQDLNKKIITSQFWYLVVYCFFVSLSLGLLISFFAKNFIPANILIFTLLSGFITTPRALLFYVLQATNRIKHFARITMLDRGVYAACLFFFLIFEVNNYQFLIVSDLIGKLVGLIATIYICKDIIFSKVEKFKITFLEIADNINIGFKLMVANLASMLINGIVRLNIENEWGIEVFGEVSLTMSISNFFMIFINAIGIIMFPMLRRTSREKLPTIFNVMNTILMVPLFFIFIFYIPIKEVLTFWLPQYDNALNYMSLLLPSIIYESKMAMINNTYLKALRKEKEILIVNVATVILCLITTFFSVYMFNSLTLTLVSIVYLLAFRCIFAEIIISKILEVPIIKNLFLELGMTTIFILISWYLGGWGSSLIYGLSFLTYLFFKKDDIITLITKRNEYS